MKRARGFLVLVALCCLVLAATTGPATAATDEEIQASIEQGIAYLAGLQHDDGSWGWGEPVATTALVLTKLEDRAIETGFDPFDPDYAYANNIERGWRYLFANGASYEIAAQDHTAGASGTVDDPDANGNGTGVAFASPGGEHHGVYSTGLVMMALVSSGDADRAADTYGYPAVATFGEISQECADWMAYAQCDLGASEGGWSYWGIDNGSDTCDNSNSGYAVLGMAAAQGFGSTVPDWVKTELDVWIGAIQDPVDGDADDGGSKYQPFFSWVNELKTGNLTFQMTFVGDTPAVQRFQDALDYIERHWMDANYDPGWGYGVDPAHFQAMFCLMKGLEYSGVDLIDLDSDGVTEHDWYVEFADVIVGDQRADGSWWGGIWGNDILDTAWALLTLEKVTPPPPVVEVCVDIKPMSWPNPFNVGSRGVLPVAIMGTADFDVTTVDPLTVMLVGVAPLYWEYCDVGMCGDQLGCPDGYVDLVFHFDHAAVGAAIMPWINREVRTLELMGALVDGIAIRGQDDVIIIMNNKR
jgi:hypothetical protein